MDMKTIKDTHMIKPNIEYADNYVHNNSYLKGYIDGVNVALGVKIDREPFEGMRNGEVIKALFPQCYFLNDFPFEGSSMEKIYIDNNKDNKTHIMVQADWWNAPYQKGGE